MYLYLPFYCEKKRNSYWNWIDYLKFSQKRWPNRISVDFTFVVVCVVVVCVLVCLFRLFCHFSSLCCSLFRIYSAISCFVAFFVLSVWSDFIYWLYILILLNLRHSAPFHPWNPRPPSIWMETAVHIYWTPKICVLANYKAFKMKNHLSH